MYSYIDSFLQEQADHPNWGKVVNYLLRSGRVKTPEKGHDVGDHDAGAAVFRYNYLSFYSCDMF